MDDAHAEVARSLVTQGNLLGIQGRFEEAIPLYKEALEIMIKTLGHDHLDVAKALMNMASVLARLERFDEAREKLEQALVILRSTIGDDHPETKELVARIEAMKEMKPKAGKS